MKTIVFYILLLPIVFVSCQKEFSVENGAGLSSATFTYDGAPSACALPVISGTYMAGLALSSSSTVSLSVSVTQTGTYSITTNTDNGIHFSGSGTFTTLGAQTITLTGSGTPAAAGSFTFTPGTAGCSFTITVSAAAPPATFTYNNTGGVCDAPSINGNYAAGTALNASNTIVLGVTVTVAGSYSVSTNTANGVTFSASGVLATGAQTITLTSTNTPTAAGTFSYTPTGGCSFPVIYTAASGGGGGTGTNYLKCKIDGVLTNFNNSLQAISVPAPPFGAAPNIGVQGIISDVPGVQQLNVTVQNPGAVNTGAYTNVTFSTILDRGCIVGYYPTGFPNIYFGSSALTSNTFTVNITLLTSTRIEGNFSGTLYDQNGSSLTVMKVIDSGSFSVGL
ncbi:MAG: hypothetical protein JST86_02215 [Bacteroidetes bacterium]|nr:hypothetical protein [Bacteroidota bacterium]